MKNLIFFLLPLLFLSAKSVGQEIPKDTYSGMRIIRYEKNNAYEFRNNDSDALLIWIAGSGLESVLGIREEEEWKEVYFANRLRELLGDDYTILIPEKLGMDPGGSYEQDSAIMARYTAEGLSEYYNYSIDSYLSENELRKIFLFGGSEGASLLPLIWENLKFRDRITGMISLAGGGISQYEEFKILGTSSVEMPEDYRKFVCLAADEVLEEVEKDPESIEKSYAGFPYKRWNSFFAYRPVDHFKNVDIPVLFIHGMEDFNTPVESTKYIEEHLPGKPFTYEYVEGMGHGPATDEERGHVFGIIKTWMEGVK